MPLPPASLLTGSLRSALWRLSLPAAVSLFGQFLYNAVDAIWLGRLGTVALAAAGAAAFVIWMTLALARIVGTGVLAVVAQAIGGGAELRARLGATRALLAATAMSVASAAFLFGLLPAIFRLMGTSDDVAAAGIVYLQIIFAGLPLAFLFITLDSIFRARGDAAAPMWAMLGSLLLNAGLDPVLIFGLGPFPAMGVGGAALATVVSRAAGCWLMAGLLVRRRWAVSLLEWARERHRWPGDSWLMIRIGIPGSVHGILFSVVYMGLVRFASPFGTAPVAALTVGHRVESLAYLICVAQASALGAIVGQNLGARQVERARAAFRLSLVVCLLLLTPLVALFQLRPDAVVRIFSSDAEVLRHGADYLRIIAWSEYFMALEILCGGAFAGAGRTWLPSLVVIPLTLARLPLAHVLIGPLAARGVWAAICLSSVAKGLALGFVYRVSAWTEGLGLDAEKAGN